MNEELKLAGFIITFNRSHLVADTIRKIMSQTQPPQELLIVDNSDNFQTGLLIKDLDNKRVNYFKVGYNSGPAGAAAIGLEILTSKGYDWIYWGDDNDPPQFQEEFENLLSLTKQLNNLGAIGSVGAKYDFKRGKFIRFKDNELKGILDVDTIGGNSNMLVNAEAIRRSGILPNKNLFFGFEEFEFLQRLKNDGYRIIVSGESLLKHRKKFNRLNVPKTQKILRKFDDNNIKRQYYSYRNHIYILHHIFNKKGLAIQIGFNAIAKSLMGYSYGLIYGIKTSKFYFKAIIDAYLGKLGNKF